MGRVGDGERAAVRRRNRFVARLRRDGVIGNGAVAKAFTTVPRHAFMAEGFRTADGRWLTGTDPDFLEQVYRNEALVTKVRDGVPVSSSSQPSLMAVMLEALDLRPGSRVLEIGVGSGYNAALMSAMGATVVSVDVQPDVVIRADAALRRAGTTGVEVVAADGYDGHPGGGPYDRVIVTVGVNGAAPAWLAQLAPDGFALVPTFHAGLHPVLRVWGGDGRAAGRGVCGAGFMAAAGPLVAGHARRHPQPLRGAPLPAPAVRRPPRWPAPLEPRRYHDLIVATGAWDRRITLGGVEGLPAVECVLLDPEHPGGGAGIAADGTVVGCGPRALEYEVTASSLVERWAVAGAPAIDDWFMTFTLDGDPERPIWVPDQWSLTVNAPA